VARRDIGGYRDTSPHARIARALPLAPGNAEVARESHRTAALPPAITSQGAGGDACVSDEPEAATRFPLYIF
jgi:hypothetical protein